MTKVDKVISIKGKNIQIEDNNTPINLKETECKKYGYKV
jgi:hypothetical protein